MLLSYSWLKFTHGLEKEVKLWSLLSEGFCAWLQRKTNGRRLSGSNYCSALLSLLVCLPVDFWERWIRQLLMRRVSSLPHNSLPAVPAIKWPVLQTVEVQTHLHMTPVGMKWFVVSLIFHPNLSNTQFFRLFLNFRKPIL